MKKEPLLSKRTKVILLIGGLAAAVGFVQTAAVGVATLWGVVLLIAAIKRKKQRKVEGYSNSDGYEK